MIKFLRRIFERSKITRNTTPKIVSILVALVLWLYVMGEVNPETDILLSNIKVQLLNQEELKNDGLVVINQEDYAVDVKVSGRRNELYKISQENIKVTADLRGFPQGVNSIPLEISLPANVTIEDIKPQQIKVRLDKVVKRQKPVEVIEKGSAALGFESDEFTITPAEVLVEGPESKVNSVAKVIGEISIEKASQNIRKNVPIKAVDNEGKEVAGVEVKTKYVNVFAPIFRIRNAVIEPQIVGNVEKGYKITKVEVSPKIVLLKGKEEVLDQYNEILTEKINIEGLNKTLNTKVNLIIPDRVKIPRLTDLPEVKITVEKIETKEFTFDTGEISINNLNEEYVTNISDLQKDINVKISDVRSVLEEVKKNDLELTINTENFKEGINRAKIDINKKLDFESVVIIPKEIDVEVDIRNSANNQSQETMNQNEMEKNEESNEKETNEREKEKKTEKEDTNETNELEPGN